MRSLRKKRRTSTAAHASTDACYGPEVDHFFSAQGSPIWELKTCPSQKLIWRKTKLLRVHRTRILIACVHNENYAKYMNEMSDDFGLTPLQLETRFWGQIYLDLVGGGFGGSKGVKEPRHSKKKSHQKWYLYRGTCVDKPPFPSGSGRCVGLMRWTNNHLHISSIFLAVFPKRGEHEQGNMTQAPEPPMFEKRTLKGVYRCLPVTKMMSSLTLKLCPPQIPNQTSLFFPTR